MINVRDVLVKVFTEKRVNVNVDAFLEAMTAAGLQIVEREPTALELGGGVRKAGLAGE